FFSKAFRRDARKRFDNAEEMLRSWRKIFENVDQTQIVSTDDGEIDLEAVLSNVTLLSELATLGLSARAENALDRINAITVKDLLSIPQRRLNRMRGVGNKTRREIISLVNALRRQFHTFEPSKVNDPDTTAEFEEGEPTVAGVDLIAQQILQIKGQSG